MDCMDMLLVESRLVSVTRLTQSTIRMDGYSRQWLCYTAESADAITEQHARDGSVLEITPLPHAMAAQQVLEHCAASGRRVRSFSLSTSEPSFDLDDGSRLVASGGHLRVVTARQARRSDAVWQAVRRGDGDGLRQ